MTTTQHFSRGWIAQQLGISRPLLQEWTRRHALPAPDVIVNRTGRPTPGWLPERLDDFRAWMTADRAQPAAGHDRKPVHYLGVPDVAADLGVPANTLTAAYLNHRDRPPAFPAATVKILDTRGHEVLGWTARRLPAIRTWWDVTRVNASAGRPGPKPRPRPRATTRGAPRSP